MYRVPSRKKKDMLIKKLNLVPILDSVFIFLFFLLTSASFIKVYEINSDVPIISDQEPPKNNEKPLALTIKIVQDAITVATGVPSVVRYRFARTNTGYELDKFHDTLIKIKQEHEKENTAILEPEVNLDYEELIKIMDSIRMLENTDPSFYIKDKNGLDKKADGLFTNIIFGNIQS